MGVAAQNADGRLGVGDFDVGVGIPAAAAVAGVAGIAGGAFGIAQPAVATFAAVAARGRSTVGRAGGAGGGKSGISALAGGAIGVWICRVHAGRAVHANLCIIGGASQTCNRKRRGQGQR